MKKVLKWVGIILALIAVTAGTLFMLYVRPFLEAMKQTTTVQYDKDLTLMIGGGGNSGILVSDSLVLVIDTKMSDAAIMLHDKVKQLAGAKPIVVVNTHFHSDHTKGNKFYVGQTIIAGGNYTMENWIKQSGKEGVPTIWLKDRMDIKMGDDTATIINLGKNIHTESDVVVYLHKRKMLFAGDVILNKQAPALFGNADPDGYLDVFNWLQKNLDIQKVVPGHGEVGGIEVIEAFRQYFSDMKLAASDDSKKNELEEKYKDWRHIPIVMSTGSTIRAFKNKQKK